MKKSTLSCMILGLLILGSAFTGYAQNFSSRHKTAAAVKMPAKKVVSKTDDGIGIKPVNVYVSNKSILDDPSTMMTKYDLQTNSSNQNRIYKFSDGKIAATAQWSHQDGGWTDRGSGYNIFDGSAWGTPPTARIEDEKTGWPSIAPLGPNGEIVVSHTMLDGLKVCTRQIKGQGSWTQTVLSGPAGAVDISWPRMVTNGPDHNYVHIIATTYSVYQGLDPYAILYYRSLDGGQTWDIEHRILDGMTSSDYLGFSADIYTFAEPHGDTLAFTVGDSWTDQFIMKSTDNGTTWTKTIIWPCPYNFWAGGDSVARYYCPDGTSAISLDKNGMAHIAFGMQQATGDAAGNKYWVPYTDGLVYWNEYMPQLPEVLDPQTLYENGNYIAWVKDTTVFDPPAGVNLAYYYSSMTSNPEIVIDEADNMFVIWSGVTPLLDPDDFYLRHIFERTATINPDHSIMWHDSLTDLTSDFIQYFYRECMYPSASPKSDDRIYVLFQADDLAGSYMKGNLATGYQGQTGITENDMIVLSPLKNELYVGISDKEKPGSTFFVSPNYPNPFNGKTVVNVYLQKPGNLTMDITNVMGQKVMSIPKGASPAGSSQFVIDGSRLSAGVYFYTVSLDNQSITNKMIVQ
jgi:hypothetical protein